MPQVQFRSIRNQVLSMGVPAVRAAHAFSVSGAPRSVNLTGRPTHLGGRPSTSAFCSILNDCSQRGASRQFGTPPACR